MESSEVLWRSARARDDLVFTTRPFCEIYTYDLPVLIPNAPLLLDGHNAAEQTDGPVLLSLTVLGRPSGLLPRFTKIPHSAYCQGWCLAVMLSIGNQSGSSRSRGRDALIEGVAGRGSGRTVPFQRPRRPGSRVRERSASCGL
ncbi:unnamed protein product [Boreogadus saida]